MSIPLQVYMDALPQLQAKYEEPFTLKIEPISGLDMFYSDGSAQNYTGKIVLYTKEREYSYAQKYFTEDRLVSSTGTPRDILFETWILETTANYHSSKQKK